MRKKKTTHEFFFFFFVMVFIEVDQLDGKGEGTHLRRGTAGGLGVGVQNEGNDETVQTQHLSENENQNHSDEEPGLLGSSTNTSISNNADSEPSGKTGKPDTETGTHVNESTICFEGKEEEGKQG